MPNPNAGLSYPVYSGPCIFTIQLSSETLKYEGRTKDFADVFTIPGISTVKIYDFRPDTNRQIAAFLKTRDFSGVLNALGQPGQVTVSMEDGIYYVEILSAGSGLAKTAIKLFSKRVIRIATGLKNRQLNEFNSLVFVSHPTGRNSNSLFALYSK